MFGCCLADGEFHDCMANCWSRSTRTNAALDESERKASCFASPRDGSHFTLHLFFFLWEQVHTHTWNVRGSPEVTGDFRVRCGTEKERRLARRPEALGWVGRLAIGLRWSGPEVAVTHQARRSENRVSSTVAAAAGSGKAVESFVPIHLPPKLLILGLLPKPKCALSN